MATRSTGALDQLDAHRRWLEARLPTLFTGTLREDRDAIEALELGLGRLRTDRQLVAADRSDELVLARLDIPGSVFETLRRLEDNGHVVSDWDVEGGGPARRIYSLTQSGERHLKEWAEVLGNLSASMAGFVERVESAQKRKKQVK